MAQADYELAVCNYERALQATDNVAARREIAQELRTAKHRGHGREMGQAMSAPDPVEAFVAASRACWFYRAPEVHKLWEDKKQLAHDEAVRRGSAALAAGDYRQAAYLLEIAASISSTPEITTAFGQALRQIKREDSIARLTIVLADLDRAEAIIAHITSLPTELRKAFEQRKKSLDDMVRQSQDRLTKATDPDVKAHHESSVERLSEQQQEWSEIYDAMGELDQLTAGLVRQLSEMREQVRGLVRETKRAGGPGAIDPARHQLLLELNKRVNAEFDQLRDVLANEVEQRVRQVEVMLSKWAGETADAQLSLALASTSTNVLIAIEASAGAGEVADVLVNTPRQAVLDVLESILVDDPSQIVAENPPRPMTCEEYLAEPEIILMVDETEVVTQAEADAKRGACLAYWGGKPLAAGASPEAQPPEAQPPEAQPPEAQPPEAQPPGYGPALAPGSKPTQHWRRTFHESYSTVSLTRVGVDPNMRAGAAPTEGNDTALMVTVGGGKVWRPRDWKVLPWTEIRLDFGTSQLTSDPPKDGEPLRFAGIGGALGVDFSVLPGDEHKLNLAAGPVIGGHFHGFAESESASYGWDLGARLRGLRERKAGEAPELLGELRAYHRRDKEATATYAELQGGVGIASVVLFGLVRSRLWSTTPEDPTVGPADRMPFSSFVGAGIRIYSNRD